MSNKSLKIGVIKMGCKCDNSSCILPIVLGIIGGILVVLFGTILNIIPFLWITFGIALGALVVTLVVSLVEGNERRREKDYGCACKTGTCLILGALGALVTSVIGIAGGVLGTLLTFLVVGFLIWTVVALIILLICLVKTSCY